MNLPRPSFYLLTDDSGSYTCQIFWKGDPGIENFIIRFNSEETMKKWATQVDTQRRVWQDHARSSTNSTTHSKPSDTQFNYMRDQVLENPYREDDDDGDEEDIDTVVPGYPGPHDSYPRQNSVPPRSRSTTGSTSGDSGHNEEPPPRLPIGYPQQPLNIRTRDLAAAGNNDSYFSPVETPMTNGRTSTSSSGTFPFPRQTPPNGYHDENNRYTAPAPSRGHMPRENGYPNGRSRPSLPPNAGLSLMNRARAASSPDIHNANGPRRLPNGQSSTPVPDVPPFPTHYAYHPTIVNRSQNNSPSGPPHRANTSSPAIQRDRLVQQRTAAELANSDYHGGPARRDPDHHPLARTMTPASSFERTLTPASMDSRTMSPPLLSQTPGPQDFQNELPTQLRVKVHCPSAGSTMTLVVPTTISFHSLKDRIDAKLQRSTSVSLSTGQVKLKYLDEDDFVSIQSDEDVQTAFETWKEQQRDVNPAGLGEIELFCQR